MMRSSSPEEATIAVVIADAEAFTALAGASNALREVGMDGPAFIVDVLHRAALRGKGPPDWGWLATRVEWLGQGAVCDCDADAEIIVESLFDSVTRAWEARVHRDNLVDPSSVA